MFVGWTGYGIKKHGLLLILKKKLMSLFRLNFQEKYLEMVIKYCLGKVFFILLDPRFFAFFSNSFYFRSLFSLKFWSLWLLLKLGDKLEKNC